MRSGGAPFTEHILEAAAADDDSDASTATDRPFVALYKGRAPAADVRGLAPGRRYAFRTRAANAHGVGPPSAPHVTPRPPPPPRALPPPAVVAATPVAVALVWGADSGADEYQVAIAAAGTASGSQARWAPAYRGPATAATVGGLAPGVAYVARVRGVSRVAGPGAWSGAAVVPAARGAPPPPKKEKRVAAAVEETPISPPLSPPRPAASDAGAIAALVVTPTRVAAKLEKAVAVVAPPPSPAPVQREVQPEAVTPAPAPAAAVQQRGRVQVVAAVIVAALVVLVAAVAAQVVA